MGNVMRKPVWSAIAVATAFSVAFGGPAAAAAVSADDGYWCHDCEVRAVGPAGDSDTVYILLRDHSSDPGHFDHDIWFNGKLNPEQFLATGLAALTFRKRVEAHLAGTSDYSLVNRMYVKQP
jgi:hypothetical protein